MKEDIKKQIKSLSKKLDQANVPTDKRYFYIDDSFWADGEIIKMFPLQKVLNRVIEKIMSEESRWIDSQMKKFVPKWQQFLMLKTRSRFLVDLFGFRIETQLPEYYVSKKGNKNTRKVSIYRFNKLLAKKTFIIKY